MVKQKTVGILALQGDVRLHEQSLRQLGLYPKLIKQSDQLSSLDGLIIPGGESTALLKLAKPLGLLTEIISFVQHGGSILGTCAGAILLARKVTGPTQESLNLINITVERNSYGRQLQSTETSGEGSAKLGVKKLPMTFIRAPRITAAGPEVILLASHDKYPVLVRQDKVLAATFHPELTDDLSVFTYWLGML